MALRDVPPCGGGEPLGFSGALLWEKVSQLQETVKLRFRSFEDEQRRQWSFVQQTLGQQPSFVREAAERAARKEVDVASDRLREDLRDLAGGLAAAAPYGGEDCQHEVHSLRSVLHQQRGELTQVCRVLDGLSADLACLRTEVHQVQRASAADALESLRREVADLQVVFMGSCRERSLAAALAARETEDAEVITYNDCKEQLTPAQETEDEEVVSIGGDCCGQVAKLALEALEIGVAKANKIEQGAGPDEPRAPQHMQGLLSCLVLEGDLASLRADVEDLRGISAEHSKQMTSQEVQMENLRVQVRGYGRASGELSRESFALVEAVLRMESRPGEEELVEVPAASCREAMAPEETPCGGGSASALAAPAPAARDQIDALREETMRHLARLALRVELPFLVTEGPAPAAAPSGLAGAAASVSPSLAAETTPGTALSAAPQSLETLHRQDPTRSDRGRRD